MRRAGRRDANHKRIVKALRDIPGVSVADTGDIGRGFPDIVVGVGGLFGVNILMEIKDGDKPPSARMLTEDQQKFHKSWAGPVMTVENVDQALDVVRFWRERIEITWGRKKWE